ncbi:MDIS1-interacting receptor like kinase 2-like [Diospyros lotus]|uniref:MDIS1-interacting receptor like kinase 2-like n=1 Tax=Diospyros lotus TaxID=55363 RepID=UPI00225383FE|nr:MDIS1-interacting receptor like kinase 2-like [Diospyros lotus]
MLTGKIPQEIGGMQMLENLNLSHNRLSGSIPSSFTNGLTSVDISYNHLKGPFPSTKAFKEAPIEAYKNNDGLCGNKTGLTPCLPRVSNATKAKKLKKVIFFMVIPIVSTLFLLLVVLGAFQVLSKSATNRENELQEIHTTNLFEVWSYDGKLVHSHIMEATEHFNDKYCIGQGGYGTIYKAELQSGLIVVVKKVHSSENDNFAYLKSFENEIRALTEVRHRNIIKFHGFCSNPRHSFLVYEFLEGGSLEKVLGNEEEALKFEWSKRVNVIKGVASGLCYMHNECSPPLIHRDISTKNILLDLEYVAHISDFGTARVLKLHSSNWTSFAGTFGYTAPELAYTVEVNDKLDVYSFGVLTLEVLMGKHPSEFISSLYFASSTSSSPVIVDDILLKDILDNRIPPPENSMIEEVVSIARLAFACLNTNPQCRPSMHQVTFELSKKRPSMQSTFQMVTLRQLLS